MWLDLLFVALAVLAALWWLAAVEAKELARAHAARLCTDAGVQLLDQTVALRAVRIVRVTWGFALRWRYSFEFSADGVGRERGQLTLVARQLEAASVPRASEP